MAFVSGNSGTLTFGSTSYVITKWTLSTSVELDKFAHSSSSGVKTGVIGSRDAKGTADIKCDAVPPPVGTQATMVLAHGDFDGTGLRTYTFPAVIVERSIEVDVDTGKAVSGTISFEAVGAVVEASS